MNDDELEKELPVVYDGQIPLGEVISRVVQAIYAELSELAETMPNMSDSARKRTLADWVVKTKKQVVKLYAVVKWARDAETVQKCMNITAFLMNQNKQFDDVMNALNYAKQSLDPARLRNHDLLTSLDVLTTGSYRRLPSAIKKLIIEPSPLTNEQVIKTLRDIEDAIRFRLRMSEIVPVEMSQHRIADGRVYFTVPGLFESSLCLRGVKPDDGWFFVHVEFLIHIGGDMTGMHEFPREPTGIMRRHITDEADARLAMYIPVPPPPPEQIPQLPPRPQLPEGISDTPLVRVFNFLQIMSLSYQLEILWYQAERMRSLGWKDYLKVEMSRNRKTLTVSYWLRPFIPPPQNAARKMKPPPNLGGTLTIAIVEVEVRHKATGTARSHKARVLAELQEKSKLNSRRPSDQVEALKFEVKWEPMQGALGVNIVQSDTILDLQLLRVNADNLDFESLIRAIIEHHTEAILKVVHNTLTSHRTSASSVFAHNGAIVVFKDGKLPALKVHLVGDEHVILTVDPRTGRLNLRDTGDLATAGRAAKFAHISSKINEVPIALFEALVKLRMDTIVDILEQKAKSLGLTSYKSRNFPKEELLKLGLDQRGIVYVQLANLPHHYLVIVILDEDFKYALIVVQPSADSLGVISPTLVMQDIAWLDARRIRAASETEDDSAAAMDVDMNGVVGEKRKRDVKDEQMRKDVPSAPVRFNLDIQVLRELHAYCCARVAYKNIESQFKSRKIPYQFVNPISNSGVIPPELTHIQSSLARSVPALCVQSVHILAGAPAAEAAMPNIRVIALNWWSEKKAQVVTCVKLKYVQQPMGKTASTSAIIRPNKRIIYDTTEAVVSFLSENVNTCVNEFLEEWARVSKMVVIAREVAQMSGGAKYSDVRLLSFDLQTVEFVYAADYTVSITCTDQLSPTGGNYDLRFSRSRSENGERLHNPHEEAESFLCGVLRHGHGRLAPSIHRLVDLLRDTLPIAVELEAIQNESDARSDSGEMGTRVDTFPKGAGWYRILYGDLRHALDLRLMSDQTIAILDASHSLFRIGPLTDSSNKSGPGKMLPPPLKVEVKEDDGMSLLPIPQFQNIVTDAVREYVLHPDNGDISKIASIDTGLVCDTASVGALARVLHSKVLKQLAETAL